MTSNMRPPSVTILAWVYIGGGTIGFVSHFTEIHARNANAATVSSSSRRMRRRSGGVMSLTLALPRGGPLNNCKPMVLGQTANSAAQTGMQGQNKPDSVPYHWQHLKKKLSLW